MGLLKKTRPESTWPGVEKRHQERTLQGLLEQLASEEPHIRRWAARDLADHPEAAPALIRRLAEEDDATVVDAILSSLIRIGGQPVVRALIPLLRSENVPLRNGVVEALRALSDHVSPFIEEMLQDPDPDVRQFAIDVVAALDKEEALRWLLWVLEHEEHVNILAAAVDVLTEIGTQEVIPALQRVKNQHAQEPFLEFAVDVALQRVGGS